MGSYVKIKSIGLEKLNNSEYTNYMGRFRALVPPLAEEEDRPVIESYSLTSSLGITREQLDAFDADYRLMINLVKQSRISDETAVLADLDKRRDDLVVYFTTTVSQMRRSPIAIQAEAAKHLYNVVKPYIGIYKSANQQETQQIEGLLHDMALAENAAGVEALSLTLILDELRTVNKEYATVTGQRTANKVAASLENSKAVRARMNDLYDDMVTMAFVQSVANPSDETAAFVTAVNALIDETIALYNLRIGVLKGTKNPGEGDDDRPVMSKE